MLIACPAERLGVELPKGGPDALSAEDLQRDTFGFVKAGADPAAWFTRRMDQMHLPVADRSADHVCARRDGEGPARVLVAPWPASPGQAAQGAVLISLAKGWDGQPPPPRTTWLCIARDGTRLPDGERVEMIPVEAADLEAIHYQRLRDDTRALLERLNR